MGEELAGAAGEQDQFEKECVEWGQLDLTFTLWTARCAFKGLQVQALGDFRFPDSGHREHLLSSKTAPRIERTAY